MSIERARAHLSKWNAENRIREFEVSSATVELAALALGVDEARIAKTLSFKVHDEPVLIVMAGDARLDNAKFKAQFGTKAKMLAGPEVEPLIGHGVGGVCPFGVNPGVAVYLDRSLQRFDTVFPAAGTGNSAVELTCGELETISGGAWIDVGKLPER